MWRARFWRRTAQDSCALGAAGAWASGSIPPSPKCSLAPREIATRKVFRNLQSSNGQQGFHASERKATALSAQWRAQWQSPELGECA